jgi:hypothetical protein
MERGKEKGVGGVRKRERNSKSKGDQDGRVGGWGWVGEEGMRVGGSGYSRAEPEVVVQLKGFMQ